MHRITFNKTGYDSQIDYIKGVCILFVIWTHCIGRNELGYMLFPYWGDTAEENPTTIYHHDCIDVFGTVLHLL